MSVFVRVRVCVCVCVLFFALTPLLTATSALFVPMAVFAPAKGKESCVDFPHRAVHVRVCVSMFVGVDGARDQKKKGERRCVPRQCLPSSPLALSGFDALTVRATTCVTPLSPPVPRVNSDGRASLRQILKKGEKRETRREQALSSHGVCTAAHLESDRSTTGAPHPARTTCFA